jgi:hypothetical protein
MNLQKMNKRFNKYIKGKKDKKYNKQLIDLLCIHFEESKNNVIEYLKLMNKEQLKFILESYGTEQKKVNEFLKM